MKAINRVIADAETHLRIAADVAEAFAGGGKDRWWNVRGPDGRPFRVLAPTSDAARALLKAWWVMPVETERVRAGWKP